MTTRKKGWKLEVIPSEIKKILELLEGKKITKEHEQVVSKTVHWVEFDDKRTIGTEFHAGGMSWEFFMEGDLYPTYSIPLMILEKFGTNTPEVGFCPKCSKQTYLKLENKFQIMEACLHYDCMESVIHTK